MQSIENDIVSRLIVDSVMKSYTARKRSHRDSKPVYRERMFYTETNKLWKNVHTFSSINDFIGVTLILFISLSLY